MSDLQRTGTGQQALMLTDLNNLLKQLAGGQSLKKVLRSIVELIERQNTDVIGSILLSDENGCLRLGAAPNLPRSYNDAIDGMRIGPNAGSCGTAVHRKKRVVVKNIQTDPLWADFRDLAASHNLMACWSEPIMSANGDILGTLALYCNEPRGPTRVEYKLIENAADLTRIAIEQKRTQETLAKQADNLRKEISERKHVEQALREREELFSKTFRAGPALYAISIPETGQGRFIEVSQTWLNTFGYHRDEVIGKTTTDLSFYVRPNDRRRVMKKVDREGAVRDQVVEFRKKNGDTIECLMAVDYIDIGGRRHLLNVSTDITERNRVKAELKKSEERFRSLTELSSDWYWEQDAELRFTELSRDAKTELRFPRELSIGKKRWELPYEDVSEEVWAQHKVVLAARQPFSNFVLKRRDKNNNLRYSSLNGIPLFDADGAFCGYRGTGHDITERIRAEELLRKSEERLRRYYDAGLIGMTITSLDKEWIQFNDALCEITGYSREELLNMTWVDITHPDDLETDLIQFNQMLESSDKGYSIDKRYIRKDGQIIHVTTYAECIRRQDGTVDHLVGFVQDITARKQAEEELHKLSLSVEHSPNIVMITDKDAHIEYVNPKFTEVTGYTSDEVIGKQPNLLSAKETPQETYKELWATILAGKEWRGEFLNRKKNGELYWASQIIFPILSDEQEITHFVGLHDDITEARKLSEDLSYQATHDLLTGLTNRNEFERRLERVLLTAKQEGSEHVMCFLDLDQFKVINDTSGHVAGDELLRQLGSLLRDCIRQRDIVARLGGDEFGVLMEHCSLSRARRVAEDIRSSIEDYKFVWEGKAFSICISIGIVLITTKSQNLTEVMKHADSACYAAKDAGRNRVHIYNEEDAILRRHHGEMQSVAHINHALKDNRFFLLAQPIVAVKQRISEGIRYELLLRMRDESGKLELPGAFLNVAERYSISPRIDRWVIDNAFNRLADNPVHLEGLSECFINLSALSLGDDQFLTYLLQRFNETAIPPEKICFEITETAAIANLASATVFIKTLKDLGCRFALDDFGSGLSSFAYLKTLPVDYLKIDGMFVRDIAKDPIDLAMVKSINEIGQVMGKQTIAEFVENDAILDKLCELGVDYAQGYGISVPKPIEELFRSDRLSGKLGVAQR